MIKNERGITILTLVITVILLIILIYVGIDYGGSSLNQIKFQNFSYQLQQIQGRVDSMHEKMKMQDNPNYIFVDGKTMGVDVTDNANAQVTLKKIKGISYTEGNITLGDEDYYTPQNETLYRYFSKRNLENLLDIKNPGIDVIINFKTREVISVEGLINDEKIYYRLEDIK